MSKFTLGEARATLSMKFGGETTKTTQELINEQTQAMQKLLTENTAALDNKINKLNALEMQDNERLKAQDDELKNQLDKLSQEEKQDSEQTKNRIAELKNQIEQLHLEEKQDNDEIKRINDKIAELNNKLNELIALEKQDSEQLKIQNSQNEEISNKLYQLLALQKAEDERLQNVLAEQIKVTQDNKVALEEKIKQLETELKQQKSDYANELELIHVQGQKVIQVLNNLLTYSGKLTLEQCDVTANIAVISTSFKLEAKDRILRDELIINLQKAGLNDILQFFDKDKELLDDSISRIKTTLSAPLEELENKGADLIGTNSSDVDTAGL